MGWLDNLENGIHPAEDDDQPGPSGIGQHTTMVEEFVPPDDDENIATTSESIDAVAEENGQQQDEIKEVSPYVLFADKVTIAGLPEAYGAKLKIDRVMFRSALIIALVMIIHGSVAIIKQYQQTETVYTDLELVHVAATFPNVSVCVPPLLNDRGMEELLLKYAPEAAGFLAGHNTSEEAMIDLVRRMLTMNVRWTDWKRPEYHLYKNVFDRVITLASEDGIDAFKVILEPRCSDALSECHFYGVAFDCCEVAMFSTIWIASCFIIDMSWTHNQTLNDPMRLQSTGLSFDIRTDLTESIYDEINTTSSGFHVFIHGIPSQTGVPLHVPSGADVLINLAESKRIEEKYNCRREPRNLEYFPHEDDAGVNCAFQVSMDVMNDRLGCSIPCATYYSKNRTCPFDLLFFISATLANGELEGLLSMSTAKGVPEMEIDPMKLLPGSAYATGATDCRPLCTRWVYPDISATYGFIRYRNQSSQLEESSGSMAYSRIRVIMPLTTRAHIEEKKKSAVYLAMCDISGIMGVYAGFSMVTIVQILAYGANIPWQARKKKRVIAIP